MKNRDYRCTNRVYHRMDTGDARPIRKTPRQLLLVKQAEVGEMLGDMQQRGVIGESDSPWSSPAFLFRRKMETSASVLTTESWMMWHGKTLSHCLGSTTHWFSNLDLQSGYWQLVLHREDKEKTFSTGQAPWQFMVVPFSLCNAPAKLSSSSPSFIWWQGLRPWPWHICLEV
jgi:hypothetical protein